MEDSITIRLKPLQEIQNTKFSEYLDVHVHGCPDGNTLAYGTETTNRAGAAVADIAVVTDPVNDRTGYALADIAALVS